MNVKTALLAVALALPLSAAPLFPQEHWARDAVAALTARGLIEGYPDGTFKGDRASSRYEVAMLVARLLARMEAENATFATRAELEDLRKLTEAFRDELGALGVRVTNLEEQAGRLDKRVTELERITFYGRLSTRVLAQDFRNRGTPHNGGGAGVPFVDYQSGVTGTAMSTLRPQIHGVMPQVDYRAGKPITAGIGFTSRAVLGMHLVVSPTVKAGAELVAFTSQGDRIVDGYYGLSSPYLLNSVTANLADPTESLDHTPYTRMVLDRFWVLHEPSQTKLVVGSFDRLRMPGLVYSGIPNLNVNEPARFPGFGFQLQGKTGRFAWEVLASPFGWGDGNLSNGLSYQHGLLGADASYEWEHGRVNAGWVRLADLRPPGGSPQIPGLFTGNVAFGASAGWTPNQWVNPPGYFALQSKNRPISGWDPFADNAVGGSGGYGPQQLDTFGVVARHTFELDETSRIRLGADFGHSQYRANRQADFSQPGNAFRFELGGEVGKFDASLAALSVDPTFNPMNLPGNLLGARFPLTANFAGRFFLHDNVNYPHNRQGLELKSNWKFDQDHGRLWLNASLLRQTRTSLYDVRSPAGSLGLLTPTNDVIGYSPGFFDPVFSGFAHPSIYGATSVSSFGPNLEPLENPRGHEKRFTAGVSYQWERVGVRAQVDRSGFFRPSSFSQNFVDLLATGLQGEVSYKLDERWTALAGMDVIRFGGHLDPAGLYQGFFGTNLDHRQIVPMLGIEHPNWSLRGRWLWTEDLVPGSLRAAGGAAPHPFSWSGYQVWSEYALDF